MDATCEVKFRAGYWYWELKRPDGKTCAQSTELYTTAEEAEAAMEEAAALLKAACLSFFAKRAA